MIHEIVIGLFRFRAVPRFNRIDLLFILIGCLQGIRTSLKRLKRFPLRQIELMPFESFLFLAQAAEKATRLYGWANVQEQQGVAISIVGLSIVFSALVLVSLFIAVLPWILDKLSPWLPHVDESHDSPSIAESTGDDEKMVVAAIGYVLHTEMQKAMEK